MPHSAFVGQTPDEIYRGLGAELPAKLAGARRAAREARLAANRALSCAACVPPDGETAHQIPP